MALADLEQLEGPWRELMESKDPKSVALAFRFALMHLAQTSEQIKMADVIQQQEIKLAPRARATALKAVSHEGMQGAAEV
jgi:hypothetical protein